EQPVGSSRPRRRRTRQSDADGSLRKRITTDRLLYAYWRGNRRQGCRLRSCQHGAAGRSGRRAGCAALGDRRGVHAAWLAAREALAGKKAQGVRIGRPATLPQEVVAQIQRLRAEGLSFAAIAERLNDGGVATAQGGRQWYPATVRYTLQRSR